MKVCFKDRLQHQLHCGLHDAVSNRRYPQRPCTSLWFGNVHPPHRMKAIALAPQLLLQLAKHLLFFSPRHNALDRFAIHARRAPVCPHLSPGLPKHVVAPYLVVQTVDDFVYLTWPLSRI